MKYFLIAFGIIASIGLMGSENIGSSNVLGLFLFFFSVYFIE